MSIHLCEYLNHFAVQQLTHYKSIAWWFSLSVMSNSCNPMDHSLPVPLSMGFSRQEYWSRLPFPSPGELSDPGIEPRYPALQADFFST